MLRFRPIAPKPPSTNGSLSGGRSNGSASPENSGSPPSVRTGRRKRRHATGKRCGWRKRRCSPENTDSGESVCGGEKEEIRTLPLLPEASDAKAASASKKRFPLWLSFENGGRGVGETAVAEKSVAVSSWVKIECVTDTWQADLHPYGRVCSDAERLRGLEVDTCPGFVTDGVNRVRWTNSAYRRMVAAEGEVAVEKGVAVPRGSTGFTCRARVVTCGKERASKTVPCDVWRMECGGFAWRLDTEAALSLSLLLR